MWCGMAVVRVTVEGVGLSKAARGSGIVYSKWVRPRAKPAPGSLVELVSPRGDPVACGLWDGAGPVAVRVLGTGACRWGDPVEAVVDRLSTALGARARAGLVATGSYRLVNSDGDYMSGLIVDVYAGRVAVVQSSSRAWDSLLAPVTDWLVSELGVEGVYEKSTQRSRRDIGLPARQGWLRGRVGPVVVEEGSARFLVDVARGQKTGFYLDQRPNRLELERLVSEGDRVLDVFSYTGGFGIHAALAGAREVWFLEEDPVAIELLRRNLRLNGVERYRIVASSIWRAEGVPEDYFDVVVVDPPAFIQRGTPEALEKGTRAYLAAYTWAMRRARDEFTGYLSSCSYFLTRDMFLDTLNKASIRAGAELRMLGSLRGAGPDHVYRGEEYLDYLKGAFVYGVKPGRREYRY